MSLSLSIKTNKIIMVSTELFKMNDENKTKEQLINEVKNLRQRVAELKNLKTERKSEKEALQENEMQFRALVQSANKAIITIDSHSNITDGIGAPNSCLVIQKKKYGASRLAS